MQRKLKYGSNRKLKYGSNEGLSILEPINPPKFRLSITSPRFKRKVVQSSDSDSSSTLEILAISDYSDTFRNNTETEEANLDSDVKVNSKLIHKILHNKRKTDSEDVHSKKNITSPGVVPQDADKDEQSAEPIMDIFGIHETTDSIEIISKNNSKQIFHRYSYYL